MITIMEPRPAAALEFWSEIEPLISRALRYDIYNTVTVEQLKQQVGEGFARVLLAHDGTSIKAACIGQLFRNTLDERILHVIAVAGEESSSWLEALRDYLEEIAGAENCAAVTIAGRPGWTKKLVKLGFRTDMVSMRMEVNDGRRIRSEQESEQTGRSESADERSGIAERNGRILGVPAIR